MPWEIMKSGDEYCVHKKDGEQVACHKTEEEAKRHMAALYANEKSLDLSNTLAFDGGAVKALGGGRVGGYLVLFSGPDDPDLQRDYFTKETDFFIESGEQRPILYRHGAHPVIKSRKLGKAKVTVDDIGVFVEGELELRDKYEKAIYVLAQKGKLGWSSGSMSHLVEKSPVGKSFEVVSWPIGEASLTPTPVEGRTMAMPLKDLGTDDIDLDSFIKSLEEPPKEPEIPFSTEGLPALDQFCKDVSPNSGVTGEQRSKSAVDAVKEFITAGSVLGEAFGVYTSRLLRRTENRAIKHADPVHPDTAVQVEGLLSEMDKAQSALGSVKEVLVDLKRLSDLSKAEQKAMMMKARRSLLNYYRISGYKPEELEDVGTSTSQHL